VPADGRVIHLDVDGRAEHLALAHPQARRVSVIALRDDGTLGDPVAQPGPTDTGFFAHQARFDPEDRGLVACAMGRDASGDTPEEPGELTAFRYRRGLLTHTARVRLGPGLGPRHLEFAHGRVYVAVERGNRLAVLDYADGVLAATPSFMVATLADPATVRPLQRAGAIHFHPNRRWLYLTNRANAAVERESGGDTARVYVGGENDVALFHVDSASGEPRLAGHFETQGIEPRTFTIDPTGAYLIVANHSTLDALDADGRVRAIPRSWVVFRIGDEGRLTLVQKYERFTADLFWIGCR
jgi:6-phosphogluconolactonase